MFRKVIAAATASLLIALAFGAAPASAATVKNGTPCSKAGATTKSGGETFRCTKYALQKNAKLTWRSADCIKTVTAYQKTNTSVIGARAETAKTIATLDLAIASLQESITVLTPAVAAEVKVEQDRIAAIKVKLDAMKADTANLTKNAKNIKDYETAISWREITVRRLNTQITAFTSQIKKLNNEKNAANNNLSLIASGASTALTTARTICG
jgi:predicted RNase H-like nuclease (RuvC/YqgF family)